MRRAGPLDSAFLAFEARGHPLHVMAVMALDPATVPGGYSFTGLRDFIGDRLAGIPPLRQRLAPVPFGLARPRFVETDVDVDSHVHRVELGGGTLADVARYAAGFDAVPLDRRRPLWAMHVVEGLDDGTIAVVAKVHHALMDGVAGMQFMASMFSLQPQAEPVVPIGRRYERAPGPIEAVVRSIPEIAAEPVRAVQAIATSARAALRLRGAARRDGTLALPRPPRIAWNGPLGSRRTVAIASLPLREVKAVGRAAHATVNDVVLAILGGACRTYLEAHGELPDAPLVAAVPVSVRDGEGAGDTANAVSLMFASLRTDIADASERIVAVHEAAQQAKHVHAALGPDTFSAWLEVVSPLVFAAVARIYLGLRLVARTPPFANLIASNVPGPPVPLYFGGARLRGLYPLGPVYDGVGVNVTVVSNLDEIGFGIVSCPDVLSDARELAGAVHWAFAELRDSVALLDAG